MMDILLIASPDIQVINTGDADHFLPNKEAQIKF
jgi:hypothetical protein